MREAATWTPKAQPVASNIARTNAVPTPSGKVR